MSWLTLVAVGAAAAMTAIAVLLARPKIEPPRVVAALIGGALATASTSAVGLAAGYDDAGFLISMSALAGAVAVPLFGLALASGASRRLGAAYALVWAALVLPVATVAPLAVAEATGRASSIQDFGGALGLVVSAAAYAFVSARRSPLRVTPGTAVGTPALHIAAIAVFWIAFAVWLSALEGAIDEYVPRLFFAALLAPVGGGIGWLLVDRLRATGELPRRSVRFGVLAGVAAVMSCAAAIPLSAVPVVGFLAGAIAGLVHAGRRLRRARVAVRTAAAAMTAGATGLLASAIIGERAGFVADANIQTLTTQVAAFTAVVAWAAVIGLVMRFVLARTARLRP